jgi:hypothetical protein
MTAGVSRERLATVVVPKFAGCAGIVNNLLKMTPESALSIAACT